MAVDFMRANVCALIKMMRCLAPRTMQRHNVGARQQTLQRCVMLAPQCRFVFGRRATARVIGDAHAQRQACATCSFLGDATEADQPQRFSFDIGAQQLRRRPSRPLTRSQCALAFAGAPARHQDQQQRQLGRRICQCVGRIGDDQVGLLCRGQVDVFIAGAEVGDDLGFQPGVAAASPSSLSVMVGDSAS